jgi:lipoyl(octanoyl) transferase 2
MPYLTAPVMRPVAVLRQSRLSVTRCRRLFSSVHNPNLALLRHQHLSEGDGSDDGSVRYDAADHLQEQLRSKLLHWKSQFGHEAAVAQDSPRPHLLSFECAPTYTLGRRQDSLTQEQQDRLQRRIKINLLGRSPPVNDRCYTPDIRKTNRGGLTTYHGPGQIVFWPVLDMHSPLYPRYGVASYASHLESTTQRLLAEVFGIRTCISRDEPGVWVAAESGAPQHQRKIAALGVHHRRHVTALGIALNIDIPVVGDELFNPWARFVPCGLDGKQVTSVAAELGASAAEHNWDIPALADRWASIFEEGLLDSSKRTFVSEYGPVSR